MMIKKIEWWLTLLGLPIKGELDGDVEFEEESTNGL